jgi:hypothetical protein
MKRVYLPEESTTWLEVLGKTARSPNAKVCPWDNSGMPDLRVHTGQRPCHWRDKSWKKTQIPPETSVGHDWVFIGCSLIMFRLRKPLRRKRKNDFDDDDDDDDDVDNSDVDSANSNDEVASKSGSNAVSTDEDHDGSGQDDNLGRGARGRAKVLIVMISCLSILTRDTETGKKGGEETEKSGKWKINVLSPAVICFVLIYRIVLSLLYQQSACCPTCYANI